MIPDRRQSPEWDQHLDRILSAMQQAQPPAGLESRVLHRLVRLESNATPARRPGWVALISSVAVGAALSVGIIALHSHAAKHSSGSSVPYAATAQPELRLKPPPNPTQDLAHVATKVRQRLNTASSPKTSDAHPQSFPAPEPAPTAEEKLLVQVAAAGRPEPLELLDPTVIDRLIAQGDADFQEFVRSVNHSGFSSNQPPAQNSAPNRPRSN